MEQWYEPFFTLLGMVSSLQTGWNVSTWQLYSHQPCFYTPPGRRCDQMFTGVPTTSTASASAQENKGNSGMYHTTDASSKVRYFFEGAGKDCRTIAKRIFARDFSVFGYSTEL